MYKRQGGNGAGCREGKSVGERGGQRKCEIGFYSKTWRAVSYTHLNGADLIELGIPFSDPTAEGPVIQQANLRALAGGVTTDQIFDMVAQLRKDVKTPMVFMTYANVLFSYGAERFIAKSAELGIDGFILPDIPFEEKEEFRELCDRYGRDLISLIAPTSENRIAMIAREAQGFLYIVSSLGVTGVRSEITTDIGAMVQIIRAVSYTHLDVYKRQFV